MRIVKLRIVKLRCVSPDCGEPACKLIITTDVPEKEFALPDTCPYSGRNMWEEIDDMESY